MKKNYIPDKCKFCGADESVVVEVDQQWSDNIYAVRCNVCLAEGSHCVTEEMAIRMWGIAPETTSIDWGVLPFER